MARETMDRAGTETESVDPAIAGLSSVEAIKVGIQYQNAGKHAQAEAIYHHVLNSEPNNPEALHLLAQVAHNVGDPDLAMTLLKSAVQIDPLNPRYYQSMGDVLLQTGHEEAARACVDKAASLLPGTNQVIKPVVHVPRLHRSREIDLTSTIFVIVGLLTVAAIIVVLYTYN